MRETKEKRKPQGEFRTRSAALAAPEYSPPKLVEIEERQLMLRLEELAQLEGLRDYDSARKIPLSSQRELDSKADADNVFVHDDDTYIEKDASGNLTFTDAVVGTRTLKNLGCPTYVFIKATGQSEGDLHLSDATNWGVSKAIIKYIRVVTSSTDWDLYVLQNDNGYATDDANIPKLQVMEAGNGDANIHVDLPYEDEDDSDEVHLYYLDNSGSNTADIYVIGYEMV